MSQTLDSYLPELVAESFLTQPCTARTTGDGPTKGGLAASVQTLLHPFVASLFG